MAKRGASKQRTKDDGESSGEEDEVSDLSGVCDVD
jgi:hypothetical protein